MSFTLGQTRVSDISVRSVTYTYTYIFPEITSGLEIGHTQLMEMEIYIYVCVYVYVYVYVCMYVCIYIYINILIFCLLKIKKNIQLAIFFLVS